MKLPPRPKFPKMKSKKKFDMTTPSKKRPKKKSKKKIKTKLRFKTYLELAGITSTQQAITKGIFYLTILFTLLITFLIFSRITASGVTETGAKFSTFWWSTIAYYFGLTMFIWVFIFAGVFGLLWLFFFVILDLKIFRRKEAMELVLPDYLQLVSANIRAGMTIDKALWFAVRPRFGVLSHEIEIVAKETISGEDLKTALRKFTIKYDSKTLKRSMNLLIEGIDAGGEIGGLLMKISDNISQAQIMKKEMAANVTTYSIFISVATIGAAPFLFALAGQLLAVITSITSNLDSADISQGPGGIGIGMSGVSLSSTDYMIFAVTMLTISSFFSAAIVATIKNGEIKAGIKNVPIFIGVTLALFFTISWGFGLLFSGFF